MTKTDTHVDDLLKSAHQQGALSPAGLSTLSVPDMGARIGAGLGISVDDVASSEVVLVTMMPDDSGSIRFAGNAQAVRDGHNYVLDALGQSKQKDDVLVCCRYLNGHVLYPYVPFSQAAPMTTTNYDPQLGTPLYDETVVVLGTVLAKTQEFNDAGVQVRSVTLLISDGADEGSRQATAADVRHLMADVRRSETHIVAAMGIDDGRTDFRAIFRRMGIEDRWILTPNNSASEIRRAFQVFSQSAIGATQAVQFTQNALGGFVS